MLILLGSCVQVPSDPAAVGTGTLKVHVTDKPFPFDLIESAVVTLTRVEARRAVISQPADDTQDEEAQSEPVTAEDDAEDEALNEEVFVTLFEDPQGKPFDLVQLRNGRTDLLGLAEVPAGTYTQLRLIVSGGEVTLTDGRTFPLKVPSGEQSGIKLRLTFEVAEDQETGLLLDVDLSRAFKPIPGGKISGPSEIREFKFQPSLAMRLVELAETGEIGGFVTDMNGQPVALASVTAYKDDVEVTSTSSEADGSYRLIGLTAGTYRLEVSAGGYADQQVENVVVESGQVTDVNVSLDAPAD
jgi:hypothetical protein